jgi:hypothetical protein
MTRILSVLSKSKSSTMFPFWEVLLYVYPNIVRSNLLAGRR